MKKLIVVLLGLTIAASADADPHSIDTCPKDFISHLTHRLITKWTFVEIKHEESGQSSVMCTGENQGLRMSQVLFACAPRISGFGSSGWKFDDWAYPRQICRSEENGKNDCRFAVFPPMHLEWEAIQGRTQRPVCP